VVDRWWHPREITFTREQVEWLLEHLELLKEGVWPPDPRGTGYTDAPARGSVNRHAPFETPCQIAAEVEARLAKCGLDRYLVEDRYIRKIPEDVLAQRLCMAEREVCRRINSALSYITGRRRKQYSYKEFKGHRRRVPANRY